MDNEVFRALLALYRDDAQLQNLLGAFVFPHKVYGAGSVPTNTAFPYVVLTLISSRVGRVRTIGAPMLGYDGIDMSVQISIFTQVQGMADAMKIAKRIYALTQETSLQLADGYNNPLTLFENELQTIEPDGLTQHIAQRYSVVVQKVRSIA